MPSDTKKSTATLGMSGCPKTVLRRWPLPPENTKRASGCAMASAAAAVRRSAASFSCGSPQAAVARWSSTPPSTTMPSMSAGAARGGNSASSGRSKISPMGKMPTAKSAASVVPPLQRVKRSHAKRPAIRLTTMPITSQVSTCRASPISFERMKNTVSIATRISCAADAPETGRSSKGS